MKKENPWSLEYRDGNGNRYRFREGLDPNSVFFDYTPITPALSSSGRYSGGDPAEGVLDDEQAQTLWQWIDELESIGSVDSKTRMKGSGYFRISNAEGIRSFTVRRGVRLNEFSKYLETLRHP